MIITLERNTKDKVKLTVARDKGMDFAPGGGYIFIVQKSNKSGIIPFTPSEPVGHFGLKWPAHAAFWTKARQLSERGYKSIDYPPTAILIEYYKATAMAEKQKEAVEAQRIKQQKLREKAAKPKKCAICGEEFIPATPNTRRCISCGEKHLKIGAPPPAPKRCKVCGKEIHSPTRMYYCSDECAKKAREEYDRQASRKKYKAEIAGLKPKLCAVCGKPIDRRRTYCKDCADAREEARKHNWNVSRTQKDGPQYCKICGKELHYPKRSYCSVECAIEGRKARDRERS